MKKVIMRKKISVGTKGYVAPLAIEGPVPDPNWVDMTVVERLVKGGYKIYEHLKDGRKVELNAANYNLELGDPNDPSMDIRYEAQRKMGHRNDSKTVSIDIQKKSVREILKESTKNTPQNITGPVIEEVPATKVAVQANYVKKTKYEKKQEFNKKENQNQSSQKESNEQEKEHFDMK